MYSCTLFNEKRKIRSCLFDLIDKTKPYLYKFQLFIANANISALLFIVAECLGHDLNPFLYHVLT